MISKKESQANHQQATVNIDNLLPLENPADALKIIKQEKSQLPLQIRKWVKKIGDMPSISLREKWSKTKVPSTQIQSNHSMLMKQISNKSNFERGQLQIEKAEDSQDGGSILKENETLIIKKKGIFEEYQERWEKNNKRIFRYLITWKVGDNGKIEDQLKLMITYLSIIFAVVLVICGFATTYYFHITNKENIRYSIESQAENILMNGLNQYYNSTEYIFKGYEFVLNYLNDIILSKLQISQKIFNFTEIKQFPYKGPNRLHLKGDPNMDNCDVYKGPVNFDIDDVSMTCIDWFEFNTTTKPYDHVDVYQEDIPKEKLNASIDILNYILESQLFDVFIIKMYKVYFGFVMRQAMYMFPGLILTSTPDSYVMIGRPWYNHTLQFHLDQKDEKSYRVFCSPYYDAGSNARVVSISKAILAPNINDTDKRQLVGKGRLMGVASIDIKLSEFQLLFEDIVFYETGYLAIISNQGKLLNEPSKFIKQINMEGQVFQDLSINQLISDQDWEIIRTSKEKLLKQFITLQGLQIVIASCINSENFYEGESVVIMFIIPRDEVYGAIDTQNESNLKRILLVGLITLGGFLLITFFCTMYVKKKIVNMVAAITELNQSALKLSGKSSDSSTHSKKEVMKKLNEIQQNADSEAIKELVKGFENQLKGISKLGKGGQNILKNGKNMLKYESAPLCGTHLSEYVGTILEFIDSGKTDNERSQNSDLSPSPKQQTTSAYFRTNNLSSKNGNKQTKNSQEGQIPNGNSHFNLKGHQFDLKIKNSQGYEKIIMNIPEGDKDSIDFFAQDKEDESAEQYFANMLEVKTIQNLKESSKTLPQVNKVDCIKNDIHGSEQFNPLQEQEEEVTKQKVNNISQTKEEEITFNKSMNTPTKKKVSKLEILPEDNLIRKRQLPLSSSSKNQPIKQLEGDDEFNNFEIHYSKDENE